MGDACGVHGGVDERGRLFDAVAPGVSVGDDGGCVPFGRTANGGSDAALGGSQLVPLGWLNSRAGDAKTLVSEKTAVRRRFADMVALPSYRVRWQVDDREMADDRTDYCRSDVLPATAVSTVFRPRVLWCRP